MPLRARLSFHYPLSSRIANIKFCFYSWEAILYWLYSGVITFAPLKSNGAEKRAAFINECRAANPNRPAPVSCKSVYRIAESVRPFLFHPPTRLTRK